MEGLCMWQCEIYTGGRWRKRLVLDLLVIDNSDLNKVVRDLVLVDPGIAGLATLLDQGAEGGGGEDEHGESDKTGADECRPVEGVDPLLGLVDSTLEALSASVVVAKGQRSVAAEGAIGHDLDDLLGGVGLDNLVAVDFDDGLLKGNTTDNGAIFKGGELGGGSHLDSHQTSVKGVHEIVDLGLWVQSGSDEDGGLDGHGDRDWVLGVVLSQTQWLLVDEDIVVLDIKVEGDRHDTLGKEGTVIGEEIICALDGDDKGIEIRLVDLLDLELSLRDIDQPLVNFLSRDQGSEGQEGGCETEDLHGGGKWWW
jgi:hypothetical protein